METEQPAAAFAGLKAGLPDIVICVLLAAAVTAAAVRLVRNMKRGRGSCSGCPYSGGCKGRPSGCSSNNNNNVAKENEADGRE